MADPDHARALEVLGKITPGEWRFASVEETGDCNEVQSVRNGVAVVICDDEFGGTGPKDLRAIAAVPALVALYAATAALQSALRGGTRFVDMTTEERVQAISDRALAWKAVDEALAGVEKAVNRG